MKLDEQALLAQKLARTIYQFWRVGRQKGSYCGVKQSEFILLVNLKQLITPEAKGVRVSELSSTLHITSAAVTQVINSLEEKGYVERLANPKDRRVVLVRPTSKGGDLINQAYKEHIGYLSDFVGFLGEGDSKELIRLLSLALTYTQGKQREREEP